MNQTDYVRVMDFDVRYRVSFVTEHGLVLSFTVRLEVASGDRWDPVVRFETAHGFAHCDRYQPDGTVVKHEALPMTDFNQALTFAERTVRSGWEELAAPFRGMAYE
jgi:hypothetical protein